MIAGKLNGIRDPGYPWVQFLITLLEVSPNFSNCHQSVLFWLEESMSVEDLLELALKQLFSMRIRQLTVLNWLCEDCYTLRKSPSRWQDCLILCKIWRFQIIQTIQTTFWLDFCQQVPDLSLLTEFLCIHSCTCWKYWNYLISLNQVNWSGMAAMWVGVQLELEFYLQNDTIIGFWQLSNVCDGELDF